MNSFCGTLAVAASVVALCAPGFGQTAEQSVVLTLAGRP